MLNFEALSRKATMEDTDIVYGRISRSVGMVQEASLPKALMGRAATGNVAIIHKPNGEKIQSEIIGFKDQKVVLMALEEIQGVHTDCFVELQPESTKTRVGSALLGRVIDAIGRPLDGKGPIAFQAGDDSCYQTLYQSPSHPLQREVIRKPLDMGVRAINGLLTLGRGQRVGVFAGSGVGKSVLLGMMAKRAEAQVNVIAMIGERGREVREFIEKDLGPEGLAKSVVIVATSDQSPLMRVKGAYLAATISEYFRDVQKKHVLWLMDSVTRFSMAQREIGLSLGEPPATKGYPPSVFATLPKLLERAGTGSGGGSTTGIYTVLVEGDDLDDPIADSARSILDGHIVLTRKLATRNHFPAIDVLMSTSRVMRAVTDPATFELSARIREWLAVYQQAEDLIQVGAYVRGASPKLDQAIAVQDRIQSFLRQSVDDYSNYNDTVAGMLAIVRSGESS